MGLHMLRWKCCGCGVHFFSVSQPDDTALLIGGGLVPGEVVHLVQKTELALTAGRVLTCACGVAALLQLH